MRWILLFVLPFFASPALAATGCEDIWFTRNLIMDRAGYCFSSTLGQELFDNSDCTGTTVTLDPRSEAIVDRIRALEAEHGCNVDTNRTYLDIKDLQFRRALVDLPIMAEGDWGCLGWTGPEVPLYNSYHEGYQPIGRLQPGDYVSFAFLSDAEGWRYVTTHAPVWGPLRSAGWLYWPERHPCAEEAG